LGTSTSTNSSNTNNSTLQISCLQQLMVIITANTNLASAILNTNAAGVNSVSINVNNDLLIYLLNSTQNLIAWLDSVDIKLNENKQQLSLMDNNRYFHMAYTMRAKASHFLNNTAILHFSLQKYNLSSIYFRKALNENTKFKKNLIPIGINLQKENSENNSEQKSENEADINYLSAYALNREYEIMYNLGISLLFCKQPLAAFECLSKVIDVYNKNVRLWLRLAECCIMCVRHYQNSLLVGLSESSGNLEMSEFFIPSTASTSGNETILKLNEKIKCVQLSFGSGYHHKIQLNSTLLSSRDAFSTNELKAEDFKLNSDEEKHNSKLALIPQVFTFEFAYFCLKNALNMLPTNAEIFTSSNSNTSSNYPISSLKSMSSKQSQQANASTEGTRIDKSEESQKTTIEQNNELDQANKNESNVASDASSNQINEENEISSKQANKLKTALNRQQQQTQLNDNDLEQKLFNCVWPSKPINLAELQNLRSSILTSLAYVSLCLKDYLNTIKYSNMLLAIDDQLNAKYPISKGHKYLAHFYLAEALLHQDKINECIEHLNINLRVDTDNDISFVSSALTNTSSTNASSAELSGEEKIKYKSM
jgi:hypothetical protein